MPVFSKIYNMLYKSGTAIIKTISLYILVQLTIISCSQDNRLNPIEEESDLKQLASYNLNIPEPSGLSLHIDGKSLWIVSDQTAKVYKVGPDGQVQKALDFRGEDLEGVCQSPLDSTIWVVEERKREIVQLDSSGLELGRQFIEVENRKENSGLEGIAVHPVSGIKYIVNEKNPALFVELSAENMMVNSSYIESVRDCSGLTFEPNGKIFWLVSDESRTIEKYNTTASKIESYQIPVSSAEGIAVSTADSLIYIVSDSEQKLYHFKMK